VVDLLLALPSLDLEAVNLRGQRADEVADSRGHDVLARMVRAAREERENAEEMPRIRRLEREVAELKMETKKRLKKAIEVEMNDLADLKRSQEGEMAPLSEKIDILQSELDAALRRRMEMITRHVREVADREAKLAKVKRKLENFERYENGELIILT